MHRYYSNTYSITPSWVHIDRQMHNTGYTPKGDTDLTWLKGKSLIFLSSELK